MIFFENFLNLLEKKLKMRIMTACHDKKGKNRCKVTLHLPQGDFVFQFEDFEDLGHKDHNSKYRYIYFEDSTDKLSAEYEAWHEHNIWHGHTPMATPCRMTVHVLDDKDNTTSSFSCEHILPERSLLAPAVQADGSPLVMKAADFRYLKRTEL